MQWWGVAVFALFVALWLSLLGNHPAFAAQTTPYKINYQGRLTDASGNPKPDGQYNMTFRLYNVATAGTAIWTETYDTTNRITVTGGQFTVQLGSLTALSPSTFTSYPLYLEVELPTPGTATCSTAGCASYTEGAMTPRQTMGSSAYAMNADTIDGYDAPSFVTATANTTYTNANIFKNTTNSTAAFGVQAANGTSLLSVDTANSKVSLGSVIPAGATAGTAPAGSGRPTITDNYGEFEQISSGTTGGAVLQVNVGYAYTEAAPNNQCKVAIYTDNAGKPGTLLASSSAVTLQPNHAGGAVVTSVPITATLSANTNYWLGVVTNGVANGNQITTDNLNGTSYDAPSISFASGFPATTPAGTVNTDLFYLTVSYQGTPTAAMTLNAGNVGVGTTAPTATLEVDGTTLFKSTTNSATAFQIQSSTALGILTADTTNNLVQIGSSTPDATAVLLVLDTATSNDPSGYPGAMYYNSDMARDRCYEGGVWVYCTGKTSVNLTSDVVNNNATANTMADVTGLSFHVVVGQTYHFSALINYTSAATTTGSCWAISGPASPTILSYTSRYTLTATTQTVNNLTAYDMPASSNASSLTTGNIAQIDGIIKPTATGTVTVRFASGAKNSAITAKAGSSLTWW